MNSNSFVIQVKSFPIRTIMLGMESTTARMQQEGWELSAEQNIMHRTLRVVARHRDARIYALSQSLDVDYMRAAHDPVYLGCMILNFQHIGASLNIVMQMSSMDFRPIDAMPQYVDNLERKDIEDFNIFASPLVRTKEIIVPEHTVDSLLDELLKYQEPVKAEYAKHTMRKRVEGEDITAQPKQKFHAQILSIAS